MPTEMDNFDTLSSAFLATFKSQPGAKFHESLVIKDLRATGQGRGIIATDDIPADTELFVIPREYVISVENSRLVRKVPGIFSVETEDGKEEEEEDDGEELPQAWLELILVMIYEYFHRFDNEDGPGQTGSGKWRTYWDVLPEDFDTLMFWSEVELAELQASASRAKIGKEDADRMFRKRILPVVAKYESTFYPVQETRRLNEEELLVLAHRMGSLIMAYAFDLEKENEEDKDNGSGDEEDGWTEDKDGKMAMGMVPMADMLNADAEFNAHLEHGVNELTMGSLRAIQKGEQVLNYYGPLPNSDLLRRYGYTSQKHSRFDVVEISWELIVQAISQTLEKSTQRNFDLADELEDSFILERDSGEPDETGLHRTEPEFAWFPQELIEQVTMFITPMLNIKGKSDEQHKKRLKKAFLQIMIKAISNRLAEYKTTIAEDEELLKQVMLSKRTSMAVNVRLGEKKLLAEARQFAEQLSLNYADIVENGSDSYKSAKKQKVKK